MKKNLIFSVAIVAAVATLSYVRWVASASVENRESAPIQTTATIKADEVAILEDVGALQYVQLSFGKFRFVAFMDIAHLTAPLKASDALIINWANLKDSTGADVRVTIADDKDFLADLQKNELHFVVDTFKAADAMGDPDPLGAIDQFPPYAANDQNQLKIDLTFTGVKNGKASLLKIVVTGAYRQSGFGVNVAGTNPVVREGFYVQGLDLLKDPPTPGKPKTEPLTVPPSIATIDFANLEAKIAVTNQATLKSIPKMRGKTPQYVSKVMISSTGKTETSVANASKE